MKQTDEMAALRAEVKALKVEIAGLKEFIQAMYSMISDDEEYDDDPPMAFGGNSGFGRYNT
ncbi:MAG: hypothetical protein FWH45_02595 [Methanomassiliicoccaceae archaeon]|nr:hypothetical protein [Methanomassiliicoccaceae archaeon]MCL2146049.1 hypothetical protein [Methanomassiliicoccaceae archaeon]